MASEDHSTEDHGKERERKKLFYCTQCPTSFTTKYSARLHESVHRNDRSWKCSVCNAGFNRKYHLSRHKKIHEGQKNNMCELCGKTFALKEGLISHMQVHRDNQVSCDICGNQYKNKTILKTHMKIHKNERNFTCEYCQRSFVQKVTYESHLALHKRPSEKISRKAFFKPLSEFCSICDKGFSDVIGLRRHLRKHKSGVLKTYNKLNRKTLESETLKEKRQDKEDNVNEMSVNETDNQCSERALSAILDETTSIEDIQHSPENDVIQGKENAQNNAQFDTCHSENSLFSASVTNSKESSTNVSLVPLNQDSSYGLVSNENVIHVHIFDNDSQSNESSHVNAKLLPNQTISDTNQDFYHVHVHYEQGTEAVDRIEDEYVEDHLPISVTVPLIDQTSSVYASAENSQSQLDSHTSVYVNSYIKTGAFCDGVNAGNDNSFSCSSKDLEQNALSENIVLKSSTATLTSVISEVPERSVIMSKSEEVEETDDREEGETESTGSQFSKKFKCSICAESFHMASTMSHHYQNVHKTEPCFLCRYCNQIFLSKMELQNHLDSNRCQKVKISSNTKYKCLSSRNPRHRTSKWNSRALYKKPVQRTIVLTEFNERDLKSDGTTDSSIQAESIACSDDSGVNRTFGSETSDNRTYGNRTNSYVTNDIDMLKAECGSFQRFSESLNGSKEIRGGFLGQVKHPNNDSIQTEDLSPCKEPGHTGETTSETSAPQECIMSNDYDHACRKCGQTFKTCALLKNHKLKCEKQFKCKICNEAFVSELKLLTHAAVIHDTKPFKCELCSKVFASASGFNKHKKKHKGNSSAETLCRDFLCSECGKCFSTNDALKTHFHTHSEPRPFCCKFCNMGFNQRHHMHRHIQTVHENIRNFKCSINGCEKLFSDRYRLSEHIRTHTKEKPYRCDQCDMRFSTNSIMKTHIKTQHQKLKAFSCHLCLQEFSAKHTLQKHLERHLAEEKMNPTSVNYTPGFKANIRQVTKMKPKTFYCGDCEKSFTTQRGLLAHKRMRCVKIREMY